MLYLKKSQKETKQKFKLLEAAQRWLQQSLRFVVSGTDCSLGSDVVNFDRIDLGPYCSIEAVNA